MALNNNVKNNRQIINGQICPYCNCKTERVSGSDIYTESIKYNNYIFIRCVMNKDHYVGTYATGRSLGRLADKALRKIKMETHLIFDSLWKSENALFSSRKKAYGWLSNQLNLPPKLTHIGMFDIEQCKQVILICEAIRKDQQLEK
jgi:hypothetical protein